MWRLMTPDLTAMETSLQLSTALSVGSAIVVTMFTIIVGPLVKYIIGQKDAQVASMKESMGRAFKRLDELEQSSNLKDEKLKDQASEIKQHLVKLETEVSIVGALRGDIATVSKRLDNMVTELAGIKAVMARD